MYKLRETIAIYQFIDKEEYSKDIYLIEKLMTPLNDWCYENNKFIYHRYIDFELDNPMLDMLIADASKNKFKAVLVNNIKEFSSISGIVDKLNSYEIEIKEI